jgi:hypothetical protein
MREESASYATKGFGSRQGRVILAHPRCRVTVFYSESVFYATGVEISIHRLQMETAKRRVEGRLGLLHRSFEMGSSLFRVLSVGLDLYRH